MSRFVVCVLVMVGGCSTTKNPNFCCLTEADCQAAGAPEISPCAEGLACIQHACEPAACATSGCTAAAPVCETATDMCVGCMDSADCARFSDMLVCDTDGGGACVECVTGSDCLAAKPICDAKQCRSCQADTECTSGACDDDGACVETADIVYLAPSGVDSAPCDQTSPCQDLAFAISQTSATRLHVVFASGNYTTSGATNSQYPITIHGHDATLVGGDADYPTIKAQTKTTIRDLSVRNPTSFATAVVAQNGSHLSKMTLQGYIALSVSGQVTANDLEVTSTKHGIFIAGNLVLDRARIMGGEAGLAGYGTFDITNALISGTSVAGVDFDGARGTLRFTTISGTSSANSAGLVARCSLTSAVTFEHSILWDSPRDTAVVVGCQPFVSTIAGPMPVPNTMNTNPLFVAETNGNFHLSTSSPARDATATGPTTDFEGDARPRGAQFDLGADEAP